MEIEKRLALLAKICLCGDGAVGKTSIKNRYLGKSFGNNYIPTLGADLSIKSMTIQTKLFGPKDIRFQIWDLAGQPVYGSVRPKYYWGTIAGLLIFDLTNKESFDNLDNWIYELFRYSEESDLIVFLIGNKSDLCEGDKICVTNDLVKAKLSKFEKDYQISQEIQYLKTSALSGDNINQLFGDLANQIFDRFSKSI